MYKICRNCIKKEVPLEKVHNKMIQCEWKMYKIMVSLPSRLRPTSVPFKCFQKVDKCMK
jgi:hypothetical protein